MNEEILSLDEGAVRTLEANPMYRGQPGFQAIAW